ncbi:glycosyltransferase family 2 protein [Riemerella columbina]|uniref:glycosyltransferase family 2 protein n=1 Tax=Riemerella columbina TaxID=103810 RepID=UPI00267019D7|nr:glycosyltransferase family A protein [Riemerella columbina]WKS95329.1 glycosyltransferase family 2 protein [Riemerella columbina]
MMRSTPSLSICIPVYNFNARALTNDLKTEILRLGLSERIEIILIDDASSPEMLEMNSPTDNMVRFISLKENQGRAKIRNLFLKESCSEYLLFLDADGTVPHSSFLTTYLQYLDENDEVDVVYGGRCLPQKKVDTDHWLRWNFAQKRENLSVKEREKAPYLSFQTNNFLIKKLVFEKIQFREMLTQYGYEDVVFAHDLKQAGIKIDHINNPIINSDIETNAVYIEKVEASVGNLKLLLERCPQTVEDIKLVRVSTFLKKIKMASVYRWFFSKNKHQIKQRLLRNGGPLRLLDVYKLGLLLEK